MSSPHRLVAELASPREALAMEKELRKHFASHARAYDRANEKGGVGWEPVPTPAEVALGKKYGHTWREALAWGESEPLSGREPEVLALGRSLVVYHDFCTGLGPDLPRVLAKAKAKVRDDGRGPPIVRGSFVVQSKSGETLAKELAAIFAQGAKQTDLSRWKLPKWWQGRPVGHGDDASFVREGDACTFTVPAGPRAIEALRERLASGEAREISLAVGKGGGAPVVAAAQVATSGGARAVSKVKPTVTLVRKANLDNAWWTLNGMAAESGTGLIAAGGSEPHPPIERAANGRTFTASKREGRGTVHAVVVHGKTVWACGELIDKDESCVLMSSDKGAKFRAVRLPKADCLPFFGVAAEENGHLWLAGYERAFRSTDGGKSWGEVKGLPDSARRAKTSPWGVLIATQRSGLFIARDGKITRSGLKTKDVCNDVIATPGGAIVVVGGAGTKGSAFRSGDGGKTFSPVKLPANPGLRCVAAFPDGRLVAGGVRGRVFVSLDDGKSFAALAHTHAPPKADLGCAAFFDGAVYLGGSGGLVLAVS
ncbi:MAG: hypothetical protein U0270_20205 [Labilithrix sp.]